MERIRRYGIPYKGSKNKIAEWVVASLPAGRRLVDLFAGGCAVTHCAMRAGRYAEYLTNDVGTGPRLFADAAAGKYRDERRWISRGDFFRLRGTDAYLCTREHMRGQVLNRQNKSTKICSKRNNCLFSTICRPLRDR